MTLKRRAGAARRPRKDPHPQAAAPQAGESAPQTTTSATTSATDSATVPVSTPQAEAESMPAQPDPSRHTPIRLTHVTAPPEATGRGAGVPATGRLAIGWHRGDWELARDTYQHAWEHLDFSAVVPPSFGEWIGDVLQRWATLTPERRTTILRGAAELVAEQRAAKIAELDAPMLAAGTRPPADRATPRSYRIPAEAFRAIDQARAADSTHLHGQISRGQWARDALRAELARAVRHHGGTLPTADRLTPSGRTTPRP